MDKVITYKSKPHYYRWSLLMLTALSIGVICFNYWNGEKSKQFDWYPVSSGTVDFKATGNGQFKASNVSTIYTSEGGLVDKLLIAEGDFVSKGQVLAELSNPSLRAEIELAKLHVKNAQLKLAQDQLDSDLEIKRAELATNDAETAIDVAHHEMEAYKELLVNNIVSVSQFKRVEAILKQKQNAVATAKLQYQLLQKQAKHRLNVAQTELDIAKFSLQRLTTRQHQLALISQTNGFIETLLIAQGDSVSTNSKIATVAPARANVVQLTFNQADHSRLRSGMRVSLPVNNNEIIGHIATIRQQLVNGYGQVEVEYDDSKYPVKIGQHVQGTVTFESLSARAYVSLPFNPFHTDKVITILRKRLNVVERYQIDESHYHLGVVMLPSDFEQQDFIALVN